MTVSVQGWLERPATKAGIYFAEDTGGWQFHSYEAVAQRAAKVAFALRSHQVGFNDVVVSVLPSGVEFVCGLFGSWIAGASVCPVVPPGPFEDEGAYVDHVAGLLEIVSPAVILTDAGLSDVVELAVRRSGVSSLILTVADGGDSLQLQGNADVALVQFTSGSTGRPRGVCVTFDNLNANIEMIRSWVGWNSDDSTASWLPLFHDMGLIGCLLASAASQTDLHVMRPDQFVRSPARWIRCFDVGGATLTAAPSFAFAYSAKRVAPADLDGVDLSEWKSAVIGAEPIDGSALQTFARTTEPFGFSPKTFCAAYGLAEATLAATGLEVERSPRVLRVDSASMKMGTLVEVVESSEVSSCGQIITSEWLVGCGAAFRGVDVDILDGHGDPMPDGYLGQISLRGDLVAAGYYGDRNDGQTQFAGRQLLTGDAGFLRDSELFVLGRIGESVKVRGKNVFVEDVESRLASRTELSLGQFAIIASPEASGQSVLLISERPPGDWVSRCELHLRQELGSQVLVRVLCCAKGTIRRTSSGKPRRRLMWELCGSGEIAGTEVGSRGRPTEAGLVSEPE